MPRPGDQRRHRLVGTDHDHRLRLSLPQVEQGGLHGRRVARVEPDRHRLHGAPVERAPHSAIAGAAERIVLVQHRDTGHAQVLGQPGDHLFGLLVVGGAQVEHVAPLRVAQELGAGERGDVGHVRRGGHRRGRTRRRRAHRSDQGEHLLLLDEMEGVGNGRLRLVGVIAGDQFQPAAVDTAAPVRFLERGLDTQPHVPAQLLRRTAEGGGLAEQDAAGGHAGHLRSAQGGGVAVPGGGGERQLASARSVLRAAARQHARQQHGAGKGGGGYRCRAAPGLHADVPVTRSRWFLPSWYR